MKLPRDVGGEELAKLLNKFGYSISRQTGSHLRLIRVSKEEHHITIPQHKNLKIGTLNQILKDIADNMGKTKEEICRELWGKS